MQLASLSLVQQECCLFVFLDGSAHYFDDFLKVKIFSQLSKANFYRHIRESTGYSQVESMGGHTM